MATATFLVSQPGYTDTTITKQPGDTWNVDTVQLRLTRIEDEIAWLAITLPATDALDVPMAVGHTYPLGTIAMLSLIARDQEA